ncbi:DNA-binding protein [Photorhabdus laumondii subsp. laumondii]|uniref:Photorhabdus luminescens subsp. laumondii TTO1 complete genome segment 16/17 n=2 Tax=Photorhabdus laumondii subsp. laumondii TaxID=141679 RepID=Q7MZ37_PHOLL|nr:MULTISPECIES: integrase domain-containing protein [Photorhabdus]AWK44000.1 DNA-binding protein [Photorhabdus laumondii subsp. laumondii]AXG44679.1 DNA-binding protein [Photorhabdus laumondii subsp. laumondii]AXG49315.1 DNA-binding protein [Photorhabdus laumondii subsp. laumondii]MCC8383945.1 integrase domain-containing protein [Photorhabdus laumondii]MCC8387636.1 integrase domain-containing protein [Photorhabdus laumondii]
MSKLSREMKMLAKQVGGSFKTVHDRTRIIDRFCRHLIALNIQVRDVQHLKAKHIESYIADRQATGISARTLHNDMSVFRLAGREKLVTSIRLANKTLGLSGASRAGTKFAIPDERFQAVLRSAQQHDRGLTCALQLARLLGLRSQEAVQCASSLKTWEKQLERNQSTLTIVFGTKGGRPRETRIIDRHAVQQAVKEALLVTKTHNGKLIDKPDLKTAMNFWRSHTTRLGLTGHYSPHSLRYAWAQDAIRYYLSQGFSRSEARALTSMDLGHGDGRGRYVERVYTRKED